MRIDQTSLTAFISNCNGELLIFDLKKMQNSNCSKLQPSSQIVQIKTQNAIRALDISHKDGRVFLSDFVSGEVYFYKFSLPFDPNTPLKLVSIVQGPKQARVIKYWRQRNELYIGCQHGRMNIIDICKFNKGPICKNLKFGLILLMGF